MRKRRPRWELYPAERLIKIPDRLSFDDAAAVMFKGITAQDVLATMAAGMVSPRIWGSYPLPSAEAFHIDRN